MSTKTKEIETLFADIFYIVEMNKEQSDKRVRLIRIQNPALENYVSADKSEVVKEVWQVMTPEGTIFEFDSVNEGESILIVDPVSEKEYAVQF